MSKARLGRMHAVMAGYVEHGEVPGIVRLVSRRGKVHVDPIGMKTVGGSALDPGRVEDPRLHVGVLVWFPRGSRA